jgi:cytochrome P450
VRDFLVSSREFGDYFGELLDRRIADPHDDVISDIANAEVDGERLSRAEQLAMCSQFLVAGNETTTKLITNIAYYLATSPELQERVTGDRSLVEPLVEEVLRYNAPVQGLYRTAKRDTTFHGVDVAEGSHVWLVYAAANRDAAEYECPHEMRLDRVNGRGHLSFGYGEHFCIGAGLARAEARIATEGILDHLPGLALAEGYEPAFEDSFVLRGIRALDVTFEVPAAVTT